MSLPTETLNKVGSICIQCFGSTKEIKNVNFTLLGRYSKGTLPGKQMFILSVPIFGANIFSQCIETVLDQDMYHSSEIRGLRSAKCSSETLQNLLYFIYKKTHVVFFAFDFVQLYFSPYECPGLCRPHHLRTCINIKKSI